MNGNSESSHLSQEQKVRKEKLGKVKKGSIAGTVSAVQKGLDVSRPEARQKLAKYLRNLRS